MEKLSIGKILNFHGVSGEAKVGISNPDIISSIKKIMIDDVEFNISKVRFHKNFAIVKFKEINSINELLPYKGKKIYADKAQVQSKLDKNEFLIDDLIGLKAFDDKEDYIGEIVEIQQSSANDILCIKPSDENKDVILIPFVKEIVPIVDIKGKKIVIKPIGGLL